MNKKVMVCSYALLPYSETFILNQAEALRRFDYSLVGRRAVQDGIKTPADRTMILKPTPFYAKGPRKFLRFLGFDYVPEVRRLRKCKPDVVHIHFGVNIVWFWPMARKLNAPVFITLHGFDIQYNKKFWKSGRWGEHAKNYPEDLIAIARDSRVTIIAVSKAIKKRAIEFGVPREKIVTRYIGVDISKFSPSPPAVSKRKNVLFIGRFIEKKGLIYLLQAFLNAQDTHKDARLIIVGNGPMEAELKKYAETFGVRAEFRGVLKPGEIAEELNRARVLCAPSVTTADGDAEGLNTVILEAQAAGTPVITSAPGEQGEGVIHEVTGLTHEERDAEQLQKHLERLLSDDDLADAFSKNAREHACKNFDLRKCTDLLEDLYLDKLKAASASASSETA